VISLHGSLTSEIDHFDPRFLALVEASRRIFEKDPHRWGQAPKLKPRSDSTGSIAPHPQESYYLN
jgi:hypothetical protein